MLDKLFMWWNRRYFCKEELKNKKCGNLKKSCCMYRDICGL